MKIHYSLTFKEFAHTLIWGMRQTTRADRVRIASVIGFCLLNYVGFTIYHAYREPYYLPVDIQRYLILSGVVMLIGIVCWPLTGWGLDVELLPEGIVLRRSFVSIRMPWKFINLMDEDARFIYLTFRDTRFKVRGASALDTLVPKRIFSSAGEAEKFYEQARLYCAEAGGQPRPAAVLAPTQPLTH